VPLNHAYRGAQRNQWALSQERSQAAPLLAALKAGNLRLADLSDAQRRRLWGIPLVYSLLEASEAVRDEDPYGMVELAQCARLTVEKVAARRYGGQVVADLRARTSAELANAYRLTDQYAAAWAAMKEAIQWLAKGTADLFLLARVADLTASLLAGQRRFDEATELIDQLLGLHEQLGDHHLVGRALIKKATFATYTYEPEQALQLVVAGAELIDPRREPALPVTVLQTIIWSTVECGRFRQARILLWRMRAMPFFPTDRQNQLRFCWLEAKIYDGLGDGARAEKAFMQAREGFRASRLVYPTAICGLDLASLWVRHGKRAEVRELVEEMIATFRSLGIAREALASLLLLREICARDRASDESLCTRLRMIAIYLTELEREPMPQPQRRI
jgi:tetratricopeptide (TPR) repeat protein